MILPDVSPEAKALDAIIPGSGVFPISFSVENLGTSQTAVQLSRGVSAALYSALSVTLPFRGSIVGISFQSSANKTAGTASFAAYVNGAASGASLTWSDSTLTNTVAYAKGLYPFAANAALDVRVTTDGSMAPTTNDVIVDLYVYVTQTTLL